MMQQVHKVRRALSMPLTYRNFVTAWFNRLRPTVETDRMVLYRLREGVDLIAAPGPHDVRIINEIWLEREYAFPGFVPEPGWTIVDLGANKGYYTAWALTMAPDARIISYEPDPRTYAILQANLSKFGTAFQTHQCAVGSAAGSLVLFRLAGRPGQASLSKSRALTRGEIVKEIDVEVIPFTDVVADLDHVDLLKIDVEGAEYDIILNSPRDAFDNVHRIAIEADDHDPDNPARPVETLLKHLRDVGYTSASRSGYLWFLSRQ